MSRTREVFPTGSTTLLRLQLSRTRDCAHRSRHVGLLLFFFSFGEKGACPKQAERVTLQPLALRTRFDHLKARFVFPGKRSWLAEGYWHMLLEAIWDGVSRDGPVSVLFSWRDYTIELEKPIRRVFFFLRCDGLNLQLQRFLNSVRKPIFWPDNYAFNVWNLKKRICPWLAQVEFYAKKKKKKKGPNLQQIYLSSVRKPFFRIDNQFSDWQLRFSACEEERICQFAWQALNFCQQDRHTGTPAIMGHTSSPSIVGQFSISCQFRLVNALEVRF